MQMAKLAHSSSGQLVKQTRDQESLIRRLEQIQYLEQMKNDLMQKKDEIKRLERISNSPELRQRRLRSKS